MNDELITIKISSAVKGVAADLTVAELGVLLTAVNRSLNKLVIADPNALRKPTALPYDRINQEPPFVELKVSSIRKGCIELQAIADALTAIGLDPASAKAVILSILANAIFDPEKAKTIASDVARGVKRIAQASAGKVITVAITIKGKAVQLTAKVDANGKVKVETQVPPPDDTQ